MCKLEALLETDVFSYTNQKMEKSFQYIETINLFTSKNPNKFHSAKFHTEFGKDRCTGHWAKTVTELKKAKTDNYGLRKFTGITKRNYERLRKIVFAIHKKNGVEQMDFSIFAHPQTEKITKMF